MELFSAYDLQLTLASAAAIYCLLGYWLAFGKQSWLWRAGFVCAALALLVPIRAYEPLVFFALTSLLFVAAAGGQWLLLSTLRKGGKVAAEKDSADVAVASPRFQFRLHDLLGLMAVFGAAAWMTRTLLREQVLMPWVGTLISVAVAVAITLATIGLLRGPRRILSSVVLVLVVGIAVGYFHWLHRMGPMGPSVQYIVGGDLGNQLFNPYLFWTNDSAGYNLLVLVLINIGFLAIFYGAARATQPTEAKPMPRRVWQVLGAAPYMAWILPTGWVYLQLLSYPPPPAQSRNRPNVLPFLLERGQALESLSGAQAQTVGAEVILLSKKPGFVPVPWEADLRGRKNYDVGSMLFEVQSARSISRGLDAQATTLEATDPDLASEQLMAIFRIGNMLEHEGLLVHGLVGVAIDGVGVDHLARLRRQLSSSKARAIIAEIQPMEESRDHNDVTRDQLWYSLNDRWAFRLDQVLNSETEPGSNPTFHYYGLACTRNSCMKRLLMIDLALRAYGADHGVYPSKLESLSPQYLTDIPLDPFCEKPFVYRPAAKDFVLYSVGGDGVDNGGTFGPNQYIPIAWEGYDLNLDAPHE